ncbi:putative ABC transport system permease protein [Loktanella ponticola]|uniref:Putative ABC transport system permease protein n=1 Tax=Yoonia ponticola TaxID=1524255 RepID=A0A7W9EXZ3_9RHOB|nr:ABC transporter permease [Yoonia ponticola]MBB5720595.1 putative ABC transport system permease protein [Yoonia ponticola]
MQLFTLLAGLALATALWSGVQAVNTEARASYDSAAATLGEAGYDQLVSGDDQPISLETYVALRRAGWLVSPVIEGQINGVRLIGIEPLTAPSSLGPVNLADGADIGAFLSGRGQVYGTVETLAALDVTGSVAPDLAPNVAYTDIGVAQRMLDRAGEVDLLIVAPDQPLRQLALREVAPNLIRRAAAAGSDVGKLTDSFHLNLTAFGLLSFAVGIFIVNGAIGLAFEQRRPVVRTLRALGVPLGALIGLIAVELMLMALLAGIIGVALGYVIAGMLLPGVAATLNGLYGASVAGTLQLRPSWWISGLAIALGGTALAATGALWQLSRMPLLAAAQPRAMAMAAGRRAKVQGGLAAILIIATLILAATAQGLIAGFAMLAALLIGAALGLPIILSAVLAFCANRARGVVGQWFWADTRQQLPGLSLALMALLLAMAANVGVSTMVSSFRLTFVGFLDQRLSSELYVTAADANQAAQITERIASEVDVILPIQSVTMPIASIPTEVFGTRIHDTYRDTWVLLDSLDLPWDQVASGEAILINEQLFRRAGLNVGDQVMLDAVPLTIVGVYGDYGNPIGQAVIGEDLFVKLYPDVGPLRFGVRVPEADVNRVRSILRDDVGIPDAQMINQAGIKAFSLDVFDRTFVVTTALNVLTLAVAAFAILMSLLTLATMRVPQLSPAWAVGMTRAELGRLEVIRAVLLALLTAVIALPLGLALAWALLAVVNVAAFGWQLPMYLFPWDYVRLFGFAVLAAAIASLWPAIRLARTPPAGLLKVFSNER